MDEYKESKGNSSISNLIKRLRRHPELGSDPLLPLLLRFSIPAIFSYFISELYNMVDTYYVGNAVGANAIGALGAVFPVQRLVIALSLLIAFASANQMAYYLGTGDRKAAEKAAGSGLVLSLLIMIPYTLINYFARRQILPFLGAKDDLFQPAVTYVSIIIWGSPFLCLSTAMARTLLTLGHASLSLVLTSLGALINIFVDHILVMEHGMGIKGAAVATVVSQIVCFLVTLVFYIAITKKRSFAFRPYASLKQFGRLISLGLPSFIVESEDAFVMAVMNLLLFRLAGETGVNVMAMNTKVYMFLFVLILGFAYGMQTLVAFNHGAGKSSRVRRTLELSLALSLLFAILSTALFYIKAEGLLRIFVKDEALIARCVPTFRHMIVVMPLLSFYYTAVMYYQAVGRALSSIILTLLRQIIILLPLSLFFVYVLHTDLDGLFYAYPLTDVIAAGLSIILLLRLYKNNRGKP